MNCLVCRGPLECVLGLPATPPANNYDIKNCFPLALMRCIDCNHLQLSKEVNREILFRDYPYVSDTGEANRSYFKHFAADLMKRFKPKFTVDIGSNDGLFLSYFNRTNREGTKKYECEVLGVDPSNVPAKVDTIREFFDKDTANTIRVGAGVPDLITAINVFAHNADLTPILKGVKLLLAAEGTFVVEVAYAMNMLKNNTFDLIYHEHFHHWNLRPLYEYLKGHGLHIFDAEIMKTHGGSLRVYAKHERLEKSKKFNEIWENERIWFNTELNKFRNNVFQNKLNTVQLLKELAADCHSVSMLGYPAKACAMSYYYELDSKLIHNIYDDNPNKIGKVSHRGFTIKDTKDIFNDKPEYLLVASWNYADELMKRFKDCGAKFIIPFPTVRIV